MVVESGVRSAKMRRRALRVVQQNSPVIRRETPKKMLKSSHLGKPLRLLKKNSMDSRPEREGKTKTTSKLGASKVSSLGTSEEGWTAGEVFANEAWKSGGVDPNNDIMQNNLVQRRLTRREKLDEWRKKKKQNEKMSGKTTKSSRDKRELSRRSTVASFAERNPKQQTKKSRRLTRNVRDISGNEENQRPNSTLTSQSQPKRIKLSSKSSVPMSFTPKKKSTLRTKKNIKNTNNGRGFVRFVSNRSSMHELERRGKFRTKIVQSKRRMTLGPKSLKTQNKKFCHGASRTSLYHGRNSKLRCSSNVADKRNDSLTLSLENLYTESRCSLTSERQRKKRNDKLSRVRMHHKKATVSSMNKNHDQQQQVDIIEKDTVQEVSTATFERVHGKEVKSVNSEPNLCNDDSNSVNNEAVESIKCDNMLVPSKSFTPYQIRQGIIALSVSDQVSMLQWLTDHVQRVCFI